MARRLRIQFAGARYHGIHRGNPQHDVFATGGAIAWFIRTLPAAVGRFRWRRLSAVPQAWIAALLCMETPSSVRANLSRRAIRIAAEGEWPASANWRVDHPVESTISGLTPSGRALPRCTGLEEFHLG
jgi:hypothetical protein